MDRRKQHAALLLRAEHDLERALAVIGDDAREAVIGQAKPCRIIGMDFDERLRQMLPQPRARTAARHGVPLIANAPGVESQRPLHACRAPRQRLLWRNKARSSIIAEESAVEKEPVRRADIAETMRP